MILVIVSTSSIAILVYLANFPNINFILKMAKKVYFYCHFKCKHVHYEHEGFAPVSVVRRRSTVNLCAVTIMSH